MPTIKYRELRRRYELDGAKKTVEHLSEALTQGHLRPEDFSLRDLAEGLIPDGHQWIRMLDPRNAGNISILEAADGVDVTAFLNVTGQIIYSKILDSYAQEAFVVSKLVDTIPTRLDGEKIPGAGGIGDQAAEVPPGMPYPHIGFGEDYIETPATKFAVYVRPLSRTAPFETIETGIKGTSAGYVVERIHGARQVGSCADPLTELHFLQLLSHRRLAFVPMASFHDLQPLQNGLQHDDPAKYGRHPNHQDVDDD